MTFGTWLKTWIQGDSVGIDEFGNRYYRSKRKKPNQREHRWVVYKGIPEASKVPPEWHAWLHHTVENPLTEELAKAYTWQLDHMPNVTGTGRAIHKSVNIEEKTKTRSNFHDYEPWQPDQ